MVRTTQSLLIAGALANKPFNSGNAWSRLGWALGFRRLGFDVVFVEQISRENCVDRSGARDTFEESVNLKFFREVMEEFGLSDRSALICDDGDRVFGLPLAELAAHARRSDLLFNFGGHLTHPELKELPSCKIYYDDDPGFTQFWHALGQAGTQLAGHDHYFTVGGNIGSPDCDVPSGDIVWQHTRPPVALEHWPAVSQPTFNRFTTVASWRGAYGPVRFNGKNYGLKVHEFRRFMELPQRCDLAFEIALDIHPADQQDLDALRNHGWSVMDPKQVAGSPQSYRHYLQSSGAEFSVAQEIYVNTNSGWISDRTVRYLASGRPALVQDTGFSRHVPTGEGLIPFKTMEEAVAGAEMLARDYERHCTAARRLAEQYFDSDKVIGELLTKAGLGAPNCLNLINR